MSISAAARKNHEKLLPNHTSTLMATDLEFIELFDNFAFDEVLSYGNLDDRTRIMTILATLIASQSLREYKVMLGGRGIKLPLEGQSTTSPETRLEKGLAAQKAIFGDLIDAMYKESPESQLHIQRYLSGNCFGDYYTVNVGNDKETLLAVVTQLVPYVGYPRALNAIRCLNEVIPGV